MGREPASRGNQDRPCPAAGHAADRDHHRHPPFRGDDVSEVLAGILKDEPDWTALPADTPMLVNLTLADA